MSCQAQVEQQRKEEVKELEKEQAVLEKELDAALKKGENADHQAVAAQQNKIADSIDSDLKDLKEEIKQTKEEAGVKPSKQQANDKKSK